jgi:glycosyltransferase involved in cell wall biosynthesis
MRILQVLHDFLPQHVAGVEIYTDELARALAERHVVALLFSEVDQREANYALRRRSHAGMPAYEIVNNHRYASFDETYRHAAIDRALGNVLDEFRPDVIHIQHLLNLSFGLIAEAKRRGIPMLMTLHDHWLACANGGQRFQRDVGRCEELDAARCGACTAHLHGVALGARRLLHRALARGAEPERELALCEIEPAAIETPDPRFVYRDHYALRDAARPTWVAHPPARLRFALALDAPGELCGAVALHPSTYDESGGGVRFRASVDGRVEFDATLDPKRRSEDRRALELRVPLGAGRVELVLETEASPGDTNEFCTAGWIDLRVAARSGRVRSQLHARAERWKTLGRGVAQRVSQRAQTQRVLQRWDEVRALFDQIHLFVSPSRYLRDEFVRFGLPESRVIFCDHGFAGEGFERRSDLPELARSFCFIGSPVPHKGLHVLLEAFDGMPPDARLDVFGSLHYDPAYAESLQRRARHPGVRLAGSLCHDEVPKLLAGVDALVIPSIWHENSPLTLREAFLAGVPVVASRLGGHTELLEQGGGLLYDADDPIALRRALLRLYGEPGLCRKLADSAPPVKTLADHVAELEAIYRELGRGA